MVSIIVPFYNSERDLPQCIESILRQSYTEWELILVNDGSTDRSTNVCESFRKKDGRITIITKKNEGVDKARFTGLTQAQGDYVTFIDSDDWIESDALAVMVEIMESHHVDYAEIGMRRVLDKFGIIKRNSISPVKGHLSQPQLFEDFYLSFFGYNILSVNMCGKLYRKDKLEQAALRPSGLKMGEDLFFNMQLFPTLESIYISGYVGYNYRFGGITSKYNPTLYPDLKRLFIHKQELIRQYHYDKATYYINIEMMNVLKSDILQKIRFKYASKEHVITQIQEELNDPIWRDVIQTDRKRIRNTMTLDAIAQKDGERLYSMCADETHRTRGAWYTKRIAAKVLSII